MTDCDKDIQFYQDQQQDLNIARHEEILKEVRGHIETANHETGELRDAQNIMKVDIGEMKKDITWVKNLNWLSISLMVAGFAGLAYLIIEYLGKRG